MYTKSFKLMAMASAVALGMTFYAGAALAASTNSEFDPLTARAANPEVWDLGIAQEFGAFATMENTFTVDVTDINFGTIGATAVTGEQGIIVMNPTTSALVDTPDTGASLVSAGTAGVTRGILAISGAHPATLIYTNYASAGVTDLTCDVLDCPTAGNPSIIVTQIIDNLATTPGQWNLVGAEVEGSGTTTGGGALTIGIGATLGTDTTSSNPYQSGPYEGSFTMTLEY